MIDFYTFKTFNGQRVSIMLEETGFEYTVHKVHLRKGEQKLLEFLKINPSGRIPAIIDRDSAFSEPLVLNQSAAILLYLAEKSGCLLPSEPVAKARTLEWLMFNATDIGPNAFCAFYFTNRITPTLPDAADVLVARNLELYQYFDRQLADNEYLAGDGYTIADIATFPSVVAKPDEIFKRYKNIQRWAEMLLTRPAVQRGLLVPED